ncbi:MAG TPA: murein L,D-transpeptidase family protein [Xanthobacteraceae bacterium]
MSHSTLFRLRAAVIVAGCALALSGCLPGGGSLVGEKSTRPLSNEMVETIEHKGMAKETPILVRIFKEESELEVWKQTKEGQYDLLKTYPICRWSGELGPKVKQGDRQAPEGFYMISPGLMNPNSAYYLAFNMGFPNAFDKALGRSGANLMVHGDCSSSGCYAMTDDQIGEIFALARESFDGGQRAFQVQAYPFRMSAANMAKHRDNPNMAFWRMLKEGNDHFEVTRQEPKVEVCDKRYVFNAIPFDPAQSFNPQRSCPVYDQPVEIVEAVKAKRNADNKEYTTLVSRGVKTAPVLTYRDGGMNPVFAAKFPERNPLNDQRSVSLPSNPQTAPEAGRPDVTSSTPKDTPIVAAKETAPTPSSDSRKTASAPAQPSRLSKLGAWLGISRKNDDQKQPANAGAQPKVQPVAQQAAPHDTPAAKAIPAAKPAQDDTADPGTMKGATPILGAGGLSYR